MGDEPVLDRVARALADGAAIDWEAEEAYHPGLKSRLRLFRDVLAIAQVHQMPAANLPAAPVPDSKQPDTATVDIPVPSQLPTEKSLFTWGSLEVRELIGRGGFGEVYRAYDPAVDREVALKLRRSDLEESDEKGARFLNEARTVARVRHPNVLVMYGAARHDGRIGLWTELLHGKTLEELLRDLGRLGAHEATLIGVDLCRALAAVHAAGLAHRDVKTTNVIREQGGRIVLMDFGSVASSMPDGTEKPARGVSGTPLFMAPEILRGTFPSPSSDLYALGVVLFRLVSGRFPIEAQSLAELAERHTRGERLRLRDLRPDLQHPFVQCVERALAPDASRRYASAGEMEQALVATLGSVASERPLAEEREPRRREAAPFRSGESILVADFDDRTDDPDLGPSLRDACEEMLSHSSFLQVIRGEPLQKAMEAEAGAFGRRLDPKLAARLCVQCRSAGFLSGKIEAGGQGFRVALDLYRAGRAVPIVTRQGSCLAKDGLLALVRDMLIDLRRFLGESPQSLADPPAPTTRSLWAYRAYAIAQRTFNTDQALALCQEAIDSDPDFAETYLKAARSCSLLGNSREYRRLAEAGLSRTSGLPERWRLRFQIEAAEASYDFDREIDLLKKQQRLFSFDESTLASLAWLYLNVFQDPGTAESYYQQLTGDSNLENNSGNMAQCLAFQGKVEELDRLVEAFRSRGLSGEVVGACSLMASLARRDWDTFDRHADRLEREPGVVRVFVDSERMGRWLTVGRLAKAERTATVFWRSAKEAKSINGMYVAELMRGWLAWRRRDDVLPRLSGPCAMARESLLFLPDLAALCVDLATEAQLEDIVAGHEAFEEKSTSRFVREEIQFARGCLSLIRGDAIGARVLIEPIARNSMLIRRHRLLGRACEALGYWREASVAYEEVVRVPNMRFWLYENPAVWTLDQFRLARAYRHLGDEARARLWFGRFVDDWKDADPDIPEVAEAREFLVR